MAKKRVKRSITVTVSTATTNSFFILCPHTGTRFLVDTGAAVSLLPVATFGRSSKRQEVDIQLCTAKGAPITTYGRHTMGVTLDDKNYTWSFIVADVTLPLLGYDFLKHYGLLVDTRHHRLIPTNTSHKATAASANINPYTTCTRYSNAYKTTAWY